jgi:hypothetical protein
VSVVVYRVDVFLFFLLGIGVVEAQVAHAAVFLRELEVQPDALGVADVQVAVGFGRKTHANLGRVLHAMGMMRGISRGAAPLAAGIIALFEVVFDHVAQKIAWLGGVVVGCRGSHPLILGGAL